MEKDGKVETIFPAIHEAARTLGKHVSSIKARISSGRAVKGILLRYITQEETDRIRQMAIDMLSRDMEEKERIRLEEEAARKKAERLAAIEEEEDVELDGEKYTILSYEMVAGRVCVTPCPYKDAPKPKVGSSLCMACGSFHGRNRRKKQVACSAVAWKPWMKGNAGNGESPADG